MIIINPGVLFPFCYQTYDQDASLYVEARVYDASTSSPVLLGSVVMTGTADGLYSGTYLAADTKSYLVIALVYTDDTYTVLDPTRSPWAECYKTTTAPLTYGLINYGAFDQDDSLYVASNIYDVTTGSPILSAQVALTDIYAGVYFTSFTGVLGQSYTVNSSVYTDDTYVTISGNRPSGSDNIQLILLSSTTIFNIDTPLILIGQNPSAILEVS